MANKKYTYHKSHTFEYKDGTKSSCITQLYQIGIYVIVNNSPKLQFNITPNKMVSIEKKLKKDEEKGIIKNLKFGIPITVTLENNCWIEVK